MRVGVDVQGMEAVHDSLSAFGWRFVTTILGPGERAHLPAVPLDHPRMTRALTTAIALKEAVMKSSGLPQAKMPVWREITLASDFIATPRIRAGACDQGARHGVRACSYHSSVAHGVGRVWAVVVHDHPVGR